MEQVVQFDEIETSGISDRNRPLAFLDTNVIVGYLSGDPSAAYLFSAEQTGRIGFAINPIIMQELLLSAGVAERPEFERIADHLRILPLDLAKAEAILPRVRTLGNRSLHSNDLLILSSAAECDFLVTRDAHFKKLITGTKPNAVTPEELVDQLRAA